MKNLIFTLFLNVISITVFAQKADLSSEELIIETDFSDRQAIITTIKNFYIGDHTGSVKHKKLSMHEKGAYRYVNNEGEYVESKFRLDLDNADPNYKEELLSIEIYDKISFARLRLDQFHSKIPEYKLMILHKVDGKWKVTSINWGYGIKQ
ncbi:hypothetical protein [Roseivirga seohaensis]|uniref:hypothetical protein n=1 Tax=Roseivirga seohaensis TaxID=1914963 RepID=UPI003BAA08AD